MNDFHGCDNLGLEPTSAAQPVQDEDRGALLALANRIEEAAERPIHISVAAAKLIRAALAQPSGQAAPQKAEPSDQAVENLAMANGILKSQEHWGTRYYTNKGTDLFRFARALLARYGAQPAASARPGKTAVFPVNILGGPMREYAPGKWENAVWPSEQPAASVEPVLRIYAEGSMRSVTEWLDGASDLPDGDHTLYAAPVAAQASGQAQDGRPTDDALWDQTLRERDEYHDMADQLAAQIAAITGEEIGEHSSANCPWRNAMLAADDYIADKLRSLCDGHAAQASGQAQDANAEPIAYSQAIEWGPRQTEQVIKVTRRPQPQYGYASALYTQAPAANADALDAAISRVRDAGVALSNAAYNLAQRAGQELTQRDADVLDRCRREWDAARDGLHAAMQRTTGREG